MASKRLEDLPEEAREERKKVAETVSINEDGFN